MNQIRPIAICVFLHDDHILVFEGYDKATGKVFYRPLGGGIEFGEHSKETICREIMEEINLEVDEAALKYLGTLENIFTYMGNIGHEIVQVYNGALKDAEVYEQSVILGEEASGESIRAVWKNLAEFGPGKCILYPDGLLEMLRPNAL